MDREIKALRAKYKSRGAGIDRTIGKAHGGGWRDSGEGPWLSEQEATDFAEAEVGVSWKVVRGADGWYVHVNDTGAKDIGNPPGRDLNSRIEAVIRAWPNWSRAERLIPEIMDHVRNGTGNRFVREWCDRVLGTRPEKVP